MWGAVAAPASGLRDSLAGKVLVCMLKTLNLIPKSETTLEHNGADVYGCHYGCHYGATQDPGPAQHPELFVCL